MCHNKNKLSKKNEYPRDRTSKNNSRGNKSNRYNRNDPVASNGIPKNNRVAACAVFVKVRLSQFHPGKLSRRKNRDPTTT